MRDWNIQYSEILFDNSKTDDNTILTRRSICDKCDQINENKICKSCGCDMAFKTQLDFARCPLNKW